MSAEPPVPTRPSQDFAVTTLRENLRQYKEVLANARAHAAQIPMFEELVRVTEEALKQIEAGQVVSEAPPPSDEYARMKVIDAVIKYLEKKRDRGLEPSAKVRDEVVPELIRGGALLDSDEERRWQRVSIAIGSNRRKVDYDEPTDTVSLKQPTLKH